MERQETTCGLLLATGSCVSASQRPFLAEAVSPRSCSAMESNRRLHPRPRSHFNCLVQVRWNFEFRDNKAACVSLKCRMILFIGPT